MGKPTALGLTTNLLNVFLLFILFSASESETSSHAEVIHLALNETWAVNFSNYRCSLIKDSFTVVPYDRGRHTTKKLDNERKRNHEQDTDDTMPKHGRHVDGCSSPTKSTHGSTCISGQSCSTNNAHNYSTHCDRQLKVRSVSQRVQVERSSNSISSSQRISELPDSPESPGDIDDERSTKDHQVQFFYLATSTSVFWSQAYFCACGVCGHPVKSRNEPRARRFPG